MADSIDRVFVHALNTVKKIPKTGAARPPPGDRMRLYGLYKQAMEGDVDGVMERPSAATAYGAAPEDIAREQDKWDAWNSQKGLSRTEAKRRYVEALIETMHRYANNTPNALELVAELEFVWNQVKSNSPSEQSLAGGGLQQQQQQQQQHQPYNNGGNGGSYGYGSVGPYGQSPGAGVRRFQHPLSGTEGGLRVLSPMSEEDESERRMREEAEQELFGADEFPGEYAKRNDKRTKRMERAIVRLSAEIAALREQISSGREWKTRKEKSFTNWIGWWFWVLVKHFIIDLFILVVLLLWMRKRKDRRLEDYVRGTLKLAREYARLVLPSR
ncbi:acyl CoA binding protein-domain-containing protein [Neurospora hispaniola]|uniref:Acyl CoA binding protein-domain-containing protein n=1 Tax=Neurospora hispaniola TaxID=588809 RepID=A0AAJ0MQD1_9PEZI|nr:acyl CoA binding protein-domain-containing protein [Neurospora hispaniola]